MGRRTDSPFLSREIYREIVKVHVYGRERRPWVHHVAANVVRAHNEDVNIIGGITAEGPPLNRAFVLDCDADGGVRAFSPKDLETSKGARDGVALFDPSLRPLRGDVIIQAAGLGPPRDVKLVSVVVVGAGYANCLGGRDRSRPQNFAVNAPYFLPAFCVRGGYRLKRGEGGMLLLPEC